MKLSREKVLDRFISYTGIYLSSLLLFSLVYASKVSGGDGTQTHTQIALLKRTVPFFLLTFPIAYLKTKFELAKQQKLTS